MKTKISIILMVVGFLFSSPDLFAQKGHYKGGRGSSHKGGHYKNSSTSNHYRKHKR